MFGAVVYDACTYGPGALFILRIYIAGSASMCISIVVSIYPVLHVDNV